MCTRTTHREDMTHNPNSLLKRKSLSAIKKNPDLVNENLSGVKTYYINLDRAIERNQLMTNEAKDLGISLTRLDAADGKKLKNSIYRGSYRFGDGTVIKYITKPRGEETFAELGCMLSHLRAIKHAYDSGDEVALILEDDVDLYTIPLWKQH